jgi:hypothetical protein
MIWYRNRDQVNPNPVEVNELRAPRRERAYLPRNPRANAANAFGLVSIATSPLTPP